eukprot:5496976-Pleurochrysis_carterae.AAC.1
MRRRAPLATRSVPSACTQISQLSSSTIERLCLPRSSWLQSTRPCRTRTHRRRQRPEGSTPLTDCFSSQPAKSTWSAARGVVHSAAVELVALAAAATAAGAAAGAMQRGAAVAAVQLSMNWPL